MRLFRFTNISLKWKLFVFVALAIVLVLTMVGTGIHYYSDISAANSQKEKLNKIALSLQRLRLVEKAFQQQQSEEQMNSFKELSTQLSNDIALFQTTSDEQLKENIAELSATFQDYLSGFENHAVVCAKHDEKEALLVKPLNDANEKLANIIKTIEEKQSLLQMEGQLLNRDELEMLNVVRDCKIGILTLQVIQYRYIQTGDSAYLKQFDTLSKGYVGQSVLSLETFASTLNNDAISKDALIVKQSLGTFLSQVKEVQKLRADILAQRNLLDKLGNQILTQIDGLAEHNTAAIASVKKTAIGALTAIVITGIVVFILVSLLLVRLITRPLSQVLEGLQSIAEGEGDLTRRLKTRSNDEIGLLARSFNAFIENLQAMIRNVSENVSSIRNASGELTEIASLMAGGSEQTTDKAKSVASASEEMSTNMVSVASAMEEASGNVNLVASATEEMTVTINAIAQNTEKAQGTTRQAVEQASDASRQVAELGQAANEIGNVVETITDISEQVNLLALNATIEAARAGDAGKGFAVVANEIKELARQTAGATLQIKQRVEGIQQSTEGTVSQIGSISRIVNDVNEIVSIIASSVEEQSVTTKEIAGNIVQVSGGIGTANDKVSHSSTVSQSISQAIAEVTSAAAEMSTSSSQINMSAEVLSDRAHQLESMITRFKI